MQIYGGVSGWERKQHVQVFDLEFKNFLPPESAFGNDRKDYFEAEILDKKTDVLYTARQDYLAYEPRTEYFDWTEYEFVQADVWSVHAYFYGGHWCGCHRIDAIQTMNPGVDIETGPLERDKCPQDRFRVIKMWHESRPDIVLYWEER